MDAIFQPGDCWLVIVDNRCTVLRIHHSSNKCQFPGESGEHPLDRVQEWLSPVWTATMLKCVRCLKRVAQKLQPGVRLDIDRKSTRLNSSHLGISYAVFCLK